jgi:hypothetical protein
MEIRWTIAWVAASLASLVACGAPEAPQPAAEVEEGEAVPIAGMYRVAGATVDKATGEKRKISGTVILALDGDDYTATFHLTTTFPGTGADPVSADVIGKGEGKIEGRTLTGVAHTQLVVASVPGVDPSFAYIPRHVSTRLISDSVTTIARDGSVVIQTDSRGEPGEDYAPTRTTLRGSRIASDPLDKRARAAAKAQPATEP